MFNIVDFPIIRKAKHSHAELKDVCDQVIYLEIDGQSVRVEKRDGHIYLNCECEFCGAKGVASNIPCRRKIRAIWYLIQMNGRISEIYKK